MIFIIRKTQLYHTYTEYNTINEHPKDCHSKFKKYVKDSPEKKKKRVSTNIVVLVRIYCGGDDLFLPFRHLGRGKTIIFSQIQLPRTGVFNLWKIKSHFWGGKAKFSDPHRDMSGLCNPKNKILDPKRGYDPPVENHMHWFRTGEWRNSLFYFKNMNYSTMLHLGRCLKLITCLFTRSRNIQDYVSLYFFRGGSESLFQSSNKFF